jgi:hypothetical protein
VPSRVSIVSWTIGLEKILTIDNLWKTHVIVIDWCYMCKCGGKTVNHLLLHWPIARELWILIFGLFGVQWVMLKSVMDMLACWQGWFGRHQSIEIWKVPSLFDVEYLAGTKC